MELHQWLQFKQNAPGILEFRKARLPDRNFFKHTKFDGIAMASVLLEERELLRGVVDISP